MVDKSSLQEVRLIGEVAQGAVVKDFYLGDASSSPVPTENSDEIRGKETGPPFVGNEGEIVPIDPLRDTGTASRIEPGQSSNPLLQTLWVRRSIFRGQSVPDINQRPGDTPPEIRRSWSVLSWKRDVDPIADARRAHAIKQYQTSYKEATEMYKDLSRRCKAYSRYSASNEETLMNNIYDRLYADRFLSLDDFTQRAQQYWTALGERGKSISESIDVLSETNKLFRNSGHILAAGQYFREVEKMRVKIPALIAEYQAAFREIERFDSLRPSFQNVFNETYITVGESVAIQQLPRYSLEGQSNEEPSSQAEELPRSTEPTDPPSIEPVGNEALQPYTLPAGPAVTGDTISEGLRQGQ